MEQEADQVADDPEDEEKDRDYDEYGLHVGSSVGLVVARSRVDVVARR